MALELWKPEEPRRSKNPTVTIQKDKTFSLSRSAWEAIGSPWHVLLWFDASKKHVVITPAEETTQHSVNVKLHVERYFRISASGFVNYYDIPHDPSRRYRVQITANEHGPQLSRLDEPLAMVWRRLEKRTRSSRAPRPFRPSTPGESDW